MILPDDTPSSPTKVQRELADAARTTDATQESSPPPYVASYPSYQHGQPITSPSASQPWPPQPPIVVADVGVRTRRRFCMALIWALLIWVLSGMFVTSVVELGKPRRRWFNFIDIWQDYNSPGWPRHADGTIHQCYSNQDPWETNTALPIVSFDLPASSDVLYLFSRGVLASGTIMFRQEPGNKNDTVTVNVLVAHRTSETAGLVSVCSLERSPGQRGVGIFTPENWLFSNRPTVDFTIVVNFPMEGDLLHIKSLETNLPHFGHNLDNLNGKISFDDLFLQTTNSHINVASVDALTATAQTTNAHIVGNFTMTKELTLTTTNGLISANVEMRNAVSSRIPTKLTMSTSNGPLTSNIDLITDSPDHKGGAYIVKARTTNDPLTIGFPTSPSATHLTLSGKTSNAPATVNLHSRYEGAFHLQTSSSSSMFVHYKEGAVDPEGLGRDRVMDITRRTRGALEGTTTWGRNSVAKKWSDVEVKTTNGPVSLAVM